MYAALYIELFNSNDFILRQSFKYLKNFFMNNVLNRMNNIYINFVY